MPELASHIALVPPSGIRGLFEIALTLDDVNLLAVGEPDVPVAPHIIEAAQQAWGRDETNYTANGGLPELRDAIVAKLARDNDVHVEREQVWVTIGATQALFQAMGLILDPGDEILVPDPGYTTFSMNARMLGAIPVAYPLSAERDFQPDLAALETLITPETKAIIVNSPSNPLGTVLPADVVDDILALAQRHGLWVISDEVYERFVYDEPHISLASRDTDDRVLSVFSLSKTYALTGIRVGYLVTPPGLAAVMRTLQEAMISCVSTPAERAAIAAITGPQDAVDDAKRHYRDNLRAATDLLDRRGIRYLEPRGAFYLWADVSHATHGDVASWAERFLLQERVAVAPGSAFGRSGEGWIRICVATGRDRLLQGLEKLPAPAS